MRTLILLSVLVAATATSSAQSITERYKRFLTDPHGYVAYRTNGNIKIDGVLDESDWLKAQPTEEFADISGEGFAKPRFKTTAKMLWDDEYLYIAAEMEEPNVWGDITKHDEVIYYNPDFEVFIDPDGDAHNYFEIEANALGTVFDLFLQKPYRAPNRPFVTFSWDTPGLKLDTHVYGTLNDSRDTDKGWTVEMAVPRKAIAAEFDNCLKAGRYLRIGFSRVEWQTETDSQGKSSRKKGADGKYLPEDNWTWPSTGMIAMHMPERWGYLFLSDKKVGEGSETFEYPADKDMEKLLWAMFYAQEMQMKEHGSYFAKIKDFRLTPSEKALLPEGSVITVETTSDKYEITVKKADGSSVSIDENGYLCRRTKRK